MQELLENSFDFSIRLSELVRYLQDEGKEFPLWQRLLICGNGIGTNLRMAEMSVVKERAVKLEQALACAVECEHLLKLMAKTGYLSERQSEPLRKDCSRLVELISRRRNYK